MAKRRRKRIASRGSVNNTILKTLINGDKYGYEIIKEVEEYSDGKIKLKQPSLYSSLSRFEEKGIVSSYWGDSDIGGRRHYYHLTDAGVKYYEKEVLKLGRDEDIEDDEDEEEIIDSIDSKETDEEITASEIDEDEIPAIVDFPEKEEEEHIPDHHFYRETPIERKVTTDQFDEQYVIKKAPSTYSAPVTISPYPKEEPIERVEFKEEIELEENIVVENIVEETNPWQNLAQTAKANNNKASATALRKLHYNKPVINKGKKVILDKDGIYKLRDYDYDPSKPSESKKPVIIDNVIKRTNPNNVYGYTAYAEQSAKKPAPTSMVELTEEEKKQRNENFLAKFNSISRSKQQDKEDEMLSKTYLHKLDMLKNSSEIEEEKPTPPPSYTPIVTRSILDEEDDEDEEEYLEPAQEPTQNNLFEYDDVDEFVDLGEDEEDSFVDLEPEQFETRNDNKQYIEEISNYSAPKETLKMNRYENKPTAILSDKTYVLINRVKFVFGIILALIMCAELGISMFLLKNKGLIIDNDNTIFIAGFVITALLTLWYIVPVMFNSSEHKLNNFKMKYAVLFGILTFLVSLILIYCVNTLMGFKLDNFEFFATKLIVPIVMVFNFVILPPIYGLLLKAKKFYD